MGGGFGKGGETWDSWELIILSQSRQSEETLIARTHTHLQTFFFNTHTDLLLSGVTYAALKLH